MDEISPLEKFRISGKRRYVEPWMTRGLETSAKKKEKLYKRTLMINSTEDNWTNYKDYRNIYNKTKHIMKITYYVKRVSECKSNTKDLWKIINEIIWKHKHKESIISYISIDGVKTYNPQTMANAFGNFYSTLGSTLSKQIKGGMNNIDYYLSKIPRNLNSVVMQPTTQCEVE